MLHGLSVDKIDPGRRGAIFDESQRAQPRSRSRPPPNNIVDESLVHLRVQLDSKPPGINARAPQRHEEAILGERFGRIAAAEDRNARAFNILRSRAELIAHSSRDRGAPTKRLKLGCLTQTRLSLLSAGPA